MAFQSDLSILERTGGLEFIRILGSCLQGANIAAQETVVVK